MEIGHRKVTKTQSYYNRFDSMYSIEEYRVLSGMISNTDFWLCRAIRQFFKEGYIYTKKYKRPFVYKNLSQYIKSVSPITFTFMYQIPFKELPLHVNEKHVLCSRVLKWRFILGK